MVFCTEQERSETLALSMTTTMQDAVSLRPQCGEVGGKIEAPSFQSPADHARVIMDEIEQQFIDGLENLSPLEATSGGLLERGSPLPLWYPRRPLQDITAILNSVLVSAGEPPTVKKETKKAQRVGIYNLPAHNMWGLAFGIHGTPKNRPTRPSRSVTSMADVASARSSMLRKGYR